MAITFASRLRVAKHPDTLFLISMLTSCLYSDERHELMLLCKPFIRLKDDSAEWAHVDTAKIFKIISDNFLAQGEPEESKDYWNEQ